jgi:phosphodiesterase/alkaline phosphatase D-like protein
MISSRTSVMKIRTYAVTYWVIAQFVLAGFTFGQVLMHGPVVGGVTDSTANVFVRTDQAATVEIHYGTDPTLSTYSTSQAFGTDPASDFTKIVPMAELTPETTYYLDVAVNGVPQIAAPYPSFTTFPPSGSARNFSFVILADFVVTRLLTEPSQTFASAAATNPVFAFIGGDFDHRNPKTLDDKRQMFKGLYDPNTPYMGDFVNLILRRMPIMHQWDDHDSGYNNDDKTYPDWNLSQQAFQEYVPSYPLPSVTPAGIWQKFSYAQADCFVLDCRSQRDVATDPDNVNKSMLDGNNLGATGELQWLENGLLTSIARWKIIFTSVITNPSTKQNDAWGAYQTEWNALRDFINTNNIQGVVFIAGDLHLGAIDNGTQSGFPEMCVAAANSRQAPHQCATGPTGTWSEGFYDDTCPGFGLVTISQDPDRVVLQAADEYGNIHVSYTVAAGTPTPSPTETPTPTPSPTGTPTPTPSPTETPTPTPAPTPTPSPTETPTPTPSPTETPTPTPAPTPTPTPTPTETPTPTPTPTATPVPPSITTQPADKTVNLGETATFRVRATGSAPLNYQWRKNGADIPGATNSSYTTPATVAVDNGSLFSVVVSNEAGSVTSNNASLTVRIPPTITTQPADTTVRVGQKGRFSVTATGTAPLLYQWTKNGVNITGATKASYTTPRTTIADDGALFAVTVSNLAGSVTSNNATLTVQ